MEEQGKAVGIAGALVDAREGAESTIAAAAVAVVVAAVAVAVAVAAAAVEIDVGQLEGRRTETVQSHWSMVSARGPKSRGHGYYNVPRHPC